MLDAAQKGGYAYPAVNVTSIITINGALRAFAEAKSDGIIQISTGGGKFASGSAVGDEAFGAIVLAEACHLLAEKYNVLVALHTDHCQPGKVDSLPPPAARRLPQAHCGRQGSAVPKPHARCLRTAARGKHRRSPRRCSRSAPTSDIILEVEAGVVGGEEDGHDTSGVAAEKLYTTPAGHARRL